MGIIAFAVIFGPFVILAVLLWLRRDAGSDLRVEVFQGGSARRTGSETPTPPGFLHPIADIKPDAEPTSTAGH